MNMNSICIQDLEAPQLMYILGGISPPYPRPIGLSGPSPFAFEDLTGTKIMDPSDVYFWFKDNPYGGKP
jgi:hypothetical protein